MDQVGRISLVYYRNAMTSFRCSRRVKNTLECQFAKFLVGHLVQGQNIETHEEVRINLHNWISVVCKRPSRVFSPVWFEDSAVKHYYWSMSIVIIKSLHCSPLVSGSGFSVVVCRHEKSRISWGRHQLQETILGIANFLSWDRREVCWGY